MTTSIRITVQNGEFYVSARHPNGQTYKADSLFHDGAKAIKRAAYLLGINAEVKPQPTHGDQK